MNVKEAVEVAECNKDVKKIMKDSFLCSCFSIQKNDLFIEWTLHYYNEEKKTITDVFVDSDGAFVGEETPAMGTEKKLDNMDIIPAEEAVELVKNKVSNIIEIMVTLHKKEKILWTINFITVGLEVYSFDIDAINKEIVSEHRESLFQ